MPENSELAELTAELLIDPLEDWPLICGSRARMLYGLAVGQADARAVRADVPGARPQTVGRDREAVGRPGVPARLLLVT